MEMLNSDEKMELLLKLEGREIVKVCQTNKKMMEICNDERYDPLWRKKIWDEFKVDLQPEENGFNKYRELCILASAKIYNVLIIDIEQPENSASVAFYNRESAEDYIFQRYLEVKEIEENEDGDGKNEEEADIQKSFENIIKILKDGEIVDIGYLRYKIDETFFNIQTAGFSAQRKIMNNSSKSKKKHLRKRRNQKNCECHHITT